MFDAYEGLVAVINRQDDMQVIAEASNGDEAVELFVAHRPDVTLMDLRMPYMDGDEATRVILAKFPEAAIIVMADFDRDMAISRATHAGAKAWFLKDIGQDILLDVIHSMTNTR